MNGLQTSAGESVEQSFRVSAALRGDAVGAADTSAQVQWRADLGESFASKVDGLVKLSSIGFPLEFLAERVPGVTQRDLEDLKAMLSDPDPLAQLTAALTAQMPAEPVADGVDG